MVSVASSDYFTFDDLSLQHVTFSMFSGTKMRLVVDANLNTVPDGASNVVGDDIDATRGHCVISVDWKTTSLC